MDMLKGEWNSWNEEMKVDEIEQRENSVLYVFILMWA